MAIAQVEVAAGARDAGTNYGGPTVYAPADVIETMFLSDSLVKEYAFSDGLRTVPAMAVAGGNLTGATSATRTAQVDVKTSTIVKAGTTIDPNAAAAGNDAAAASSAGLSSGAAIDGAATQAGALGAVTGAVASAQGLTTRTAGKIEVRTVSVGVDDHEVSQALRQGGQSQSTQANFGPVDASSGSLGAIAAVSAQQAAATANLLAPASPNIGKSSTGTVAVAEAASSAANAQAPGVAQVALSHSGGAAHSVRTMTPSLKLPVASLFQIQSSSSSSYLVETDPRFTNYRQWLGSDYMLDQLALDPAVTQKRLGDGYYEQSLMREQVTQLTSQRFLADYTSDDDQYRGLMDAGIAFAKQWNLRPGVTLSADQMAGLTSDMVWLVMQDVKLADGSVQKVLAPQVYLATEGAGPTSPALVSGRDVAVTSAGNIDNTGTIVARNTLQLVADNVNNLGGRMQGNSVLINAKTDISNIGGTISAGQELIAVAGRDIKVETTTRSASSAAGANQFGHTTIDQVGSLKATGDGASLLVSAGRDLNIVGGQIDNGGAQGTTFLGAARDINLGTVTTASREALSWDANNFHKESASTDVGSQVHGAGAVTLKAGADLNLRAANVEAGTALVAIAGNNVNLLAGTATSSLDDGHLRMEKSFLHKETITTRDTVNRTSGVGSVLSGQTVDVQAGHDLRVLGSAIVGDGDVNLIAGNAVSITAATNKNSENHYRSVKESGFLSGGGGFGISYGTRTTTTDQNQEATAQSGQARSTVGSIGGNLNVSAGDALAISGSDLSAGKDMNLAGRSVAITAGADDVNGKFTTKMTQDRLTLAIGGSVVNAIQTADSMGAAVGQTSSGRLKALAAASAVLTVKDAAQDIAKNGPSAKISLTMGHSESESTEVTASRTHGGSVLAAGSDAMISATGGGKASNIDIVGSDVRAAGKVSLGADNQVNLLAAQDSESQHSQSKSWSAAGGVAAELSALSNVGYTASVSASRGNVDGEGATQVNSHVSAGDRLTIASGGDTNLKGAVASGSQVVSDVKGNLNIESLQDTATLDGKRQSASVSGTVGAGAGFSANLSQSKVRNDYASVQEQSGIRAGDGGFQLQVAGNADLKGGVISSSEQAIKDGRNNLAAATLSFSDIQNRDSHDASGVSLGVNVGKNQKGDPFSPSMAPGIGQVSGSQGSVTRSGVSDAVLMVSDQQAGHAVVNLNRDVSSAKDMAQLLTKGWNGAQALDEVGAQMQITSSAMPRLAQKIGDYAEAKVIELNKQGNAEEAAKWAEGGIYRVAAHAALGAMGGGLGGAVGAAVSAEAAPTLSKLQDAVQYKLANAGLSSDAANVAAKLIAGGGAATMGGVAGGSAGAATGLNAEVNNRQLHPGDYAVAKTLATRSDGKYTEKEIQDALRYSGLKDSSGNTIVVEGTRETFVNNVNLGTGASLQDTIKSDGTMAIGATPGDQTTLLEKAPSRPSNELIAYIAANTGGKSSPYSLTPGATYSSSQLLPEAPTGTTRVTRTIDGAIFFPLAAACPAASCANGDPIANAIPDPGTNAYNEAVARKIEKDINIATIFFSVGGAAVRGVMTVTDFATATGAVGRALEVVGATNATSEVAGKISGTAIKTYWPPNGGFATAPIAEELGKGYQFSRYGGFFDESGAFKDFGSFVAPADVPYGMRALPPGTNLKPLSTYEVIKPIPDVPSGPSAAYFGELGLGKQHQLPLTIQDYLDQGFIRLIDRLVSKKP